jgi:DNA helicase-2/ATP-dependent DNA helicase PcrA
MKLLNKFIDLEQIKELDQDLATQIEGILNNYKFKLFDAKKTSEYIQKIITNYEEIITEEITFVPEKTTYESNDPIAKMFDFAFSNSQSFSNTIPQISKANYWTPKNIAWNQIEALNNCAVLYRTHSQSRAVEETFLKYKIPYRLVSGTRFLDRKEIKDVLAMLKFMSNGDDKISLARFLPIILDGVGPKTLEKIFAYLEDSNFALPSKFQQQIGDLFVKFGNLWNNHTTLIELAKELIVVSGYARHMKNEYPDKEEYKERMENVAELYSLMLPFDQDESLNIYSKLEQFLLQTTLMSQQDANEKHLDNYKINLMSLHQSKGLEYETVFLVGCEDGLLPHQNSLFEKGGMDEEVRLAYVGVTRAKKNLYLISADSRIQFGQIKSNPVSRIFRPFLDKSVKREV